MPRRRLRGKDRRALTWDRLTIPDMMCLRHGWHPNPGPAAMRGPGNTLLRTVDDVREAWECCRHILMEMVTIPGPRGHLPGERPWAWWQFSAADHPRRNESEADCLERLGLMPAAEREALATMRATKQGRAYLESRPLRLLPGVGTVPRTYRGGEE